MKSALEALYNSWSGKDQIQIRHDLESGTEKANVILRAVRGRAEFHPRTIVEIGCGYGVVLSRFAEVLKPEQAYGIDFSTAAIAFAQEHFERPRVRYVTASSLRIEDTISRIKADVGERVDCVILVDLLEHVPDARGIVSAFISFTKY